MKRWPLLVVMIIGLCCEFLYAQNPYVKLTGVLQGPNGLPVANDVISLTPTQSFFVAGSGGNAGVFTANPGNFGASINNLFTQSTVGIASAGSILGSFDTSGLAICCLTDALTGAMTVPSGASGVQADAVAGYIQNNSASLGGGVGGGAVAGYFVAVCGVSGANCWGSNQVASDSPSAPASKLYGIETDVNVYNVSSNVAGIIFNGNFHVQPTSAPVISIGKIGSSGTWTDGLRVNDGATSNFLAVNIGAQGTGASQPSQLIAFAGHDSGGVARVADVGASQNGDVLLIPRSGRVVTGPPPVSFTTLPACVSGLEDSTAAVSDSTTNTWGATITGSGGFHVKAYCDGTNWTVAAK